MTQYFRPIPSRLPAHLRAPQRLAGGWLWFDTVEVLARGHAPQLIHVSEVPDAVLARLTAPRAPIAGVAMDRPRVMGILNVTPDSFSDGGQFKGASDVAARAQDMATAGADILDIGGESTRPGAQEVPVADEIARIVPAITAVVGAGVTTPISLDTRKRAVAEAGFEAGARILNDVSGFTFDPALGPWAAQNAVPTCIMHSQGTPETMQDDPRYDDALLDVYDVLEASVARAEAEGLPRSHIMLDPGIGFGKTGDHIFRLLTGLSLFHGLGCAILLGVSRKGFIGRIGNAPLAHERDPGSLALGLAAIEQGVQVLRVHDVTGTLQGIKLWDAVHPRT